MFLVTLLMNDQQALNMRKIVSIPCLEMMWNLTYGEEIPDDYMEKVHNKLLEMFAKGVKIHNGLKYYGNTY
uniref:Transposase n=1 Tax=Bursaphelenchus xylophilus TaxID=6326 RepID=A0A1I7S6X7_BURXY